MAEASEFMRSSDSHGHNNRMSVRFGCDVADRMYTLIHEDRGIEYRNTHDAVRDWVLDGMERFAARMEDGELLRKVSAFAQAERMDKKLQTHNDERALIKNTEEVIRAGIDVSDEELQASMDTIDNPRNREDFYRMLSNNGRYGITPSR